MLLAVAAALGFGLMCMKQTVHIQGVGTSATLLNPVNIGHHQDV